MFDGLCILTALYLYSKTKDAEFKKISFVVLSWFIISDVAYHYFFVDFRSENNWIVYQVYNLINLAILYNLYRACSHYAITLLITSNILLNIVVSYYFIANTVSYIVYNLYPYLAGIVMLSALIYMWMLTNGVRCFDSCFNNKSFVGFLFRRCGRVVF